MTMWGRGSAVWAVLIPGLCRLSGCRAHAGRRVLPRRFDICNRIPRATQAALEQAGYRVERNARSHTFAQVHVVTQDADGQFGGGADPASGGMVLAAP